jgi:acyl-CoA reductase-like NAD-dependent aldehyde dehydrogenase
MKACKLAKQIAEEWKALSPSEREAMLPDLVQNLKDQREMKALSTRNVPMEAFQDAFKTIQSLEREVRIHMICRRVSKLIFFRFTAFMLVPVQKLPCLP